MMKTPPDINVQLVDFGITSSREFVRHNYDDSYTICINSRQASNIQLRAYLHALEHIQRGDCDSANGDVNEIEYDVHRW